ncbi:MAG: exopolyphosphatase [Ruminococcus sp.]|jgi:exopolyphosphatase/guanosine-5'-triphosphate,3'-diphosphate pyrophosphatase
MQVTMFATIEIGSYNVSLEIFELSRKNGVHSIDRVTHRLELGKTAYTSGKVTAELIDELCRVINDFTEIMKSYKVNDYRAFGTSAVREASNSLIMLETIYQRTGIRVDVLSNSEQRFLGYKGIASKGDTFQQIIEKGTAILDVSGGSIQISLFDKDNLITTQNVKLGSLRVRERLAGLERETTHYETLVEELVRNEIASFAKMHLKDRKISNIILIGNNFTDSLLYGRKGEFSEILSKDDYMQWYRTVIERSPIELAMEMGIALEYASLLIPTVIINKKLIQEMNVQNIWIPGIRLSDGIAYDFAEKAKLIKSAHNFDNDIVMAARNIGKRYSVSKSHTQMMSKLAKTIFKAMKKVHGLTERELLMLEVAVQIHDCGKYISLSNVAECSFNIIMSTEIIGLSHREREIIALAVRYNTLPFDDYGEMSRISDLREEDYILVAKLTAILRLVNALDRSHMQKIESMKANVKENELILSIETKKDFTLERGLITDKLNFFTEVFSVRPVMKVKRIL